MLGPLKLHVNHIMPTLIGWLTQRDQEYEARISAYHDPTFEGFYKDTLLSQYSEGVRDHIWPPKHYYMRM